MTLTSSSSAPSRAGPFSAVVGVVERVLPPDMIGLVARVAIAAVFFLSGRTKVDGLLTITDGTFALFRDEYRVPLLPPDVAAVMATGAEHLFPALLVLGIATRLSALALLGMTLVIEVFVYPLGWPTHLLWAAVLLYLLRFGAGRVSLDHALKLP
ncbi:MAG: DoxX family protein [Brevundimonas sp.]|nr:MAG: DoxX family protein [Brevundimonas sp.]